MSKYSAEEILCSIQGQVQKWQDPFLSPFILQSFGIKASQADYTDDGINFDQELFRPARKA
ncbi:hypothetical protein N7486_000974 [Penicillium sp. IBT 16267x]|nr:hypothetical protein N7486_000974 [Penicillium sp. IBT 16267x]